MAIDSNKRDRRHSENMDFMAPQLQRGEMDPNLSPVVTTTPQGLQLIGSPTMALPHTSLPPYSGGFIVTGGPGGTHQLVPMPHVPGIPIVMPPHTSIPVSTPSQQVTSHSSHASSEDREDVQSHSSGESLAPPAKRPALDPAHIKMGGVGGGGIVVLQQAPSVDRGSSTDPDESPRPNSHRPLHGSSLHCPGTEMPHPPPHPPEWQDRKQCSQV